MNSDCRAINDIGLYVWIDIDETVSIDLRLPDVGSMSLYEGEQRIKMLKRLYAKGKAYPFNNFQRGTTAHTELTNAVDALGITRAIVYHGINTAEMFEEVGLVIKRIANNINERLEGMKLRHIA